MLISLAPDKARVVALLTVILCIQVDIGKVYNYLNALATQMVTSILIAPQV